MLVDLLVSLLVAFPTVARVFWFLLHGFFTNIRASFEPLLVRLSAPVMATRTAGAKDSKQASCPR